ncbi:MAG: 50S ribosomal protein L15 [Defluviitaleaceae bacterium]|nr:50S ribosomal protein L15 [Defluviitaleaceae bacterium]
MQLGQLKPAAGSKRKAWRRGRGHGSGNGKWSGRGQGGQKSRSGGGVRPTFEGGQFPLFRRVPKRGFKNRNTLDIVAINVYHLDVFENGATVDIAALQSKGLVSNPRDGVKILGQGEVTKKLHVKVDYFSESAKEKIEAAGGSAEVI